MSNNNSHRLNNREVCGFCFRSITIGQPITVCKHCDLIFHGRCITTKNFDLFRDKPYCSSCMDKNEIRRYNPFFNLFNDLNPDRFYDDEPSELVESVEKLSKILEDCEQYSSSTLNRTINSNGLQSMHSSFFLNIDGNKSNFNNLVASLSTVNHRFSIVALAETNIDASEKDLFCLGDDYTSVYQSKIENKCKGSGLALYIRNGHNFTIHESLNHCTPDIETLFVNITGLERPTVVGVVYRPPSGNIDKFNCKFQSILTELNDSQSYILGDTNINLHNIQSIQHRRFEESVITSGFTPLISTATHQQPNCTKTCIDNIFCNQTDKVILSGTLDLDVSNHLGIFQFSKLVTPKLDHQDKITIHYDYSNSNIEKFCSVLHARLRNSDAALQNFDTFTSCFLASVDAGCKLATPRTTKRNSINNPWITQGLKKSVEQKQKLKHEWKKSKSNKLKDGDPIKKEAYKAHCRCQKSLVNLAKKKYYYQAFDDNKGSSKKTWQIINKLRGKVKCGLKASFRIDNELITCRRAIANKFNTYFTSLARNLNANAYSETPLESFPSFHSYLSQPCPNSIFLEDCSADEIVNIIKDLKNGKASDIPIVLIKQSAMITAPHLAPLFNQCISSGNFPDTLKIAKITPIYKKGDRENIENYRPISTLPVFGKIFEKLIYSRVYNFFSSQDTLDDAQFGFRQNHSTAHAIQHSINIINDAHRQQKHVIGIFIDLSKAFDTLDHGTLLDKLYNCGIRGVAHDLLSSYLSGRKQCTSFLDECSGFEAIEFGVPQGSVLGPLLFLVYINDIMNSINDENCKLVLYADDTNVFVIDICRDAAIAKANIVLKRINDFMKSNLLHINLGKCCYMHFEPPKFVDPRTIGTCARSREYIRKSDGPKVKLNGHVIEEVTSTKFLGVIIDSKLSWIPHIEMLYKKLKSATGILNQITKNIPVENFKSLYHALFESHMNYCLTIYGSAGKNHTEKLFRVQKHCLRILFGNREEYLEKFNTCARAREFGNQILGPDFYAKENSKPIFTKNKILALQNVYSYQTCLEVLKLLKLHSPPSLYARYTLSQRNNSTLLILPPHMNEFTYTSSKMWNIAMKILAKDESLIDIKLGTFKKRLKYCLLDMQNKFDDTEWYPGNLKLELLQRDS